MVFQLQQSPFHSLTTVHDDQFHFSKQHILIINNKLLHDITWKRSWYFSKPNLSSKLPRSSWDRSPAVIGLEFEVRLLPEQTTVELGGGPKEGQFEVGSLEMLAVLLQPDSSEPPS